MNARGKRWKNLVRWALLAVLAADAVLAVVNWQPGVSPRAQQQEVQRLRRQRDLLKADIQRAVAISKSLPAVQRECDRFFDEELQKTSTGYSSVAADLAAIAKKAGLETTAVTFRQRELAERGVVEVEVSTRISGDYPSLVSFINGLERSPNFYLLDDLDLDSGAQGALRLNLKLRTYFRS